MPQYGYDAGNKRIERDTEFTFWAGNQKWETYTTAVNGGNVTFTLTGVSVYFGGRLIGKATTHSAVSSVAQDRLGSMNGKFYPFGQRMTRRSLRGISGIRLRGWITRINATITPARVGL